MRKGSGPDSPGNDPFSSSPIGSFPSTSVGSQRANLRASVGGSSHIFGCPEAASVSNKPLTCVSSCMVLSLPGRHYPCQQYTSGATSCRQDIVSRNELHTLTLEPSRDSDLVSS